MQKYNFHFLIQLTKWIFRGFKTTTTKTELELHEAIATDKTVKFLYVKEATGELREAIGTNLKQAKNGNIIYQDLEKQAVRSFKPENLKSLFTIL